MNLCRISVETPVGLCVAVAGYAVVESARTLDDDTRDGSLEETCRVSTTSTQKVRRMGAQCSLEDVQLSTHSHSVTIVKDVN